MGESFRTFNDDIVVVLIFNFIFACKNSPAVPLLSLPQLFFGVVLSGNSLPPAFIETCFIEWSFKCQVLF